MNKVIIIALVFLTASVVCAGEGLQPYVLFGDSGKIIEETNQSLSAALTERGFEMLGQYASVESPECSVLVFSHPELLTTLSG